MERRFRICARPICEPCFCDARKHFIDDLRLKNFSDGTIKVYVHAIELFSRFMGRSLDESTAQDVRRYLVHLIERGLSRSYCVIQRNALRHLFQNTLGRADELEAVPRPKRERRLPVVLSREEVRRLFAVAFRRPVSATTRGHPVLRARRRPAKLRRCCQSTRKRFG